MIMERTTKLKFDIGNEGTTSVARHFDRQPAINISNVSASNAALGWRILFKRSREIYNRP